MPLAQRRLPVRRGRPTEVNEEPCRARPAAARGRAGSSEVHSRYTDGPALTAMLRLACCLDACRRDSGDYAPCLPLERVPAVLTAHRWDRLPGCGDDPFRSGLDLPGSVFAPCLLGCPGTPRQYPAPAARRGCRQPHRTACRGMSRYEVEEENRTEQRTLNPRVRGSSPWRRTRSDLGNHLLASLIMILCEATLRPSWGRDFPA